MLTKLKMEKGTPDSMGLTYTGELIGAVSTKTTQQTSGSTVADTDDRVWNPVEDIVWVLFDQIRAYLHQEAGD